MAEAAAEVEPDPVKRETLMQRVAHMNVVQRLTLALKGGRTERMLLIRDPNKLVQRCVLQSPRLTDTEVEAFASMTNLTGEILRAIALTRTLHEELFGRAESHQQPEDSARCLPAPVPAAYGDRPRETHDNKNVPETLRSVRPEASPQAQDRFLRRLSGE